MCNYNTALARLDLQLQCWARWYLRVVGSGLGYTRLPWMDIIHTGQLIRRTGPRSLPINETAEHMENAIGHLRHLAPELAHVLHVHYLERGEGRQKAHAMGLTYTTFTNRLRTARLGSGWWGGWRRRGGERHH